MPAVEAAGAVGRDERERSRSWRDERVGDRVRGNRSERPEPALLPGADEPANTVVVRNRGTRRGEREPAAGTLATPRDGPRCRSAAAVAERRAEPREGVAASPAQLLPGGVADDAAHGQDQV